MIEYVKGELAELTPAIAVVDCGGVGYGVNISLNTYSALQNQKQCKLYIHEAIRDDAYQLFGFVTKEERELFLLLNSVSGIGGNTARMILSSFSPIELVEAIAGENAKLLQTVKGIGKKTAERIIVDLKDKVQKTALVEEGGVNIDGSPAVKSSKVYEESVSALTMLGFAPAPTRKAVQAILKKDPNSTVEEVVKRALKNL